MDTRKIIIKLPLLLALFAFAISCGVKEENINIASKSKSTWQENIKKAQTYRLKSKKSNSTVKLLGYKYIGKINSESEIPAIIYSLFSDDAYFALTENKDRYTFHILKVGYIKDELRYNPFDKLIGLLKESLKVGMEVIELQWEYEGKHITSTAIVSNVGKGFYYDNIGHFLPEPSSAKDKSTKRTIMKSQSESSGRGR